MTEDPYNNDVPLAADSADTGDEFDGLEVGSAAPKKSSKLPLILLILLVLIAGAGFVTYKIFLDTGDMPARPIEIAQAPSGPEPTPMEATPPAVPGADASAVPSVPPGVTDPNAAATPATPADPNAVTAEAVPSPSAASVDPNAPVTAAATPPVVDPNAPAETPPAPTVPGAAPDAATATTPAAPPVTPPAEVAAATPAAAPTPTAPAPAPAATSAPPVPSDTQLKPIDPNAVMAKAEATPAVATPLPTGAASGMPDPTKVASTVNAVNDILGTPGVPTSNAGSAQIVDAAIAKQVEVTPRAKQVIFVKKSYGKNSPQAVVAAGDRMMDAGQYSDAVSVYDRQLKKNPSDPLALAGKAVAQQKAGQNEAAMDTYQRLLDLNPRDVEALTNYLGLLQKQNPTLAMSRLQNLAQQYPENAAVAGQMGAVQAGMMDTPNALRSFQKAAALDPTNPTYPFNLGVLYDRLGTSDKARDAYRNALNLAREYPERAGGVPVEIVRNRLGALSD